MVNIAHRMRKLQTVRMTHTLSIEAEANTTKYSRQFWKQILPRLKYHNPSIPISVSRFQDRTQAPKLFLHTSASPDPIALELNEGEGPETILQKMLGQLGGGGFVPVEATQEEVDALEEFRQQKEQAERDSEKGKRKRMQMKKQKEMLEMASQGAV
ncbi:hypothetical protein Vi05172_g11859 [Venturia inaequalis]|nr:hypothetical protein Vi05172_g11859 [Venturia inaequalis]